jgi:hypothetical protein
VAAKAAEGRLHTLRLNLFSAKLETGETKLIIEPNSSSEPAVLEISNLIFYPDERKVELENGNVVAAISDGTQLLVDNVSADKQSYLRFRSGRIILRDLVATVFDNQPESFGFREAEVENVSLRKGQLYLTEDQFLTFQDTALRAHFNKSRWGVGGFVFSANLKELGGQIVGGELKPNPESVIKLASGSFHTTSLAIESGAANRVTGEFDDIRFVLAPDSSLVMPGKFEVTPRPGATLVAATAVNPMKLSPLKNGPSGVLDVDLRAERIKASLGRLGFFGAREGELKGSFTFAPAEPMKGRIDRLALTSGSGSFRLNNATNLVGVTDAVVRGTDLKTGGAFGLTGKFSEVSFNIPESNTFLIPGVFRITTRTDTQSPARFEAIRPDKGIELVDDLSYPVGSFKIHVPYIQLSTESPVASDQIELDGIANGNADFDLAFNENGKIFGSNGRINGTLMIGIMDVGLKVPVTISNGEFRTNGSTPVFSGDLVAKVPPAFKYPGGLTTPYQQNIDDGDDRMGGSVLFPIKMDVSLEKTLEITSHFAVAGGMLNLAASADGTFQVVIPSMPAGAGGGEHIDRWDPGKGTKNEDEEYGRWQEAFTTTYDIVDPAGMCDAHLYLKEASYVASAKVAVNFVNNKFGATISNIRPDRTPEFHRDGCEADILLFIGNIIDNKVDNQIRNALADKIGGLKIRIGNQEVAAVH